MKTGAELAAHIEPYRWKPGQTGNPGGRPKKVYDLAILAQTHTEEAVNTLVEIMRNGDTDSAKVRAADAILDRGYGKAPQVIEVQDNPDAPVAVDTLELARRVAFLLAAAQREMKKTAIEHKGNGNGI